MTMYTLARKVRRLEALAQKHPGGHNAAALSTQVVLPPVEEFRVLPLTQQKRLLSAWRPPPRQVDLPSEEEFESLSGVERKRRLDEALGPPDPTFAACFGCLPLREQANLCLEQLRQS